MPQESRNSIRKKNGGKEYVFVSYLFVAIFVSLIGYMVYFNTVMKDEVLNSPYNKRQNSAAEHIVRGDIRSADGEVLAYTEVDGEGNEKRVYPYGSVFSHVVGYFANGKSGLETLANYQLLTSHDFIGDRLWNDLQGEKNLGDTVVTTLDSSLQMAAYNALGDSNGAAVVMEPDTGKVLAMVSKPDFDPNTLADMWEEIVNDENNSVLVNRSTQGQYAPGSTFKIVTALSYLRKNGSLDGFSFHCEGEYTQQEHTIHCANNTAHGDENLENAFAYSCNCAFAQIGLDLGGSALNETSESLLFNKKLPIVLPYRKSSFDLNDNSGVPLTMQTSFGQGNTLTSPMHMAMIVSAIANGGTLMKPYYIDHVENVNGDLVTTTKPEEYAELLTSAESSALTNLMTQVVDYGTATALGRNEYSVAGKTGTAEYFTGDGSMGTHSWFVGFSNVENPDIVVCVLVENSGASGLTGTAVAQQIFDEYYY